MVEDRWIIEGIASLQNKRIVVTGGNSGIGYEAALSLAGKGASVILAVRSAQNGQHAAEQIRSAYPQADVEVMTLDLADLASVKHFAEAYRERYKTLHVLINNAGVMALPYRRTIDNFEMQFGTNHLGHFALTGLLLPAILVTPDARVVTVSSGAHRRGKIAFDNLQGEKGYQRWRAYSQSKLANLLFAYELQRRFETAGASALSVACHPGYVATNLQSAGPRMEGSRVGELIMKLANRILAGSADKGALPTLYAATSPDVNGCDYIGPGGKQQPPEKQNSIPTSYDPDLAKRLWDVSEALTGVHYDFAIK